MAFIFSVSEMTDIVNTHLSKILVFGRLALGDSLDPLPSWGESCLCIMVGMVSGCHKLKVTTHFCFEIKDIVIGGQLNLSKLD